MASTISPLDAPHVLLGAQLPRLSAVPEYGSTSGDEAIELAAMAGLHLLPWQQWVLRHSLGERDSGKWAAFEVGLVVGRQNGKNAILEARELAELFIVSPGPRLIIHSAHQFKTALEHFRRMKRRILDTPELRRRVKGPIKKGIPAGIQTLTARNRSSSRTAHGSCSRRAPARAAAAPGSPRTCWCGMRRGTFPTP